MAGRKKVSLEDRFFEKVHPVTESGCWLWLASSNNRGYGQFMLGGRPHLAHRVAWMLRTGSFPKMHVLHKCDTPRCVNPDHLFLGTDADNVKDMLSKGRESRKTRRFGERHGCAKISNSTALAIFKADGTRLGISKAFGVSESTVGAIKSGRQWFHITGKRNEHHYHNHPT